MLAAICTLLCRTLCTLFCTLLCRTLSNFVELWQSIVSDHHGYAACSDTIREFNAERLTCLLVEQNVALSLKLASRAYLLELTCSANETSSRAAIKELHSSSDRTGWSAS